MSKYHVEIIPIGRRFAAALLPRLYYGMSLVLPKKKINSAFQFMIHYAHLTNNWASGNAQFNACHWPCQLQATDIVTGPDSNPAGCWKREDMNSEIKQVQIWEYWQFWSTSESCMASWCCSGGLAAQPGPESPWPGATWLGLEPGTWSPAAAAARARRQPQAEIW